MMKVLIFALVALPVCLSLTLESTKFDKKGVISQLKNDFELTPDDLKEECNVDIQSAWRKIAAALDKFNEIYIGITDEASNLPVSGDQLSKQYLSKCQNSEPYNKARMNVIKTALPCAEKETLDKHEKKSKPHTC